MQPGGIALGVIEDVNLQEKELRLENNDIVVLYTDGITEAVNGKNEQFGETRFIAVVENNSTLSPRGLADKIKDEVFTFAHGQPQHDDFTLVVLKATCENGD
jgi:sigma-B regulation protein RsbU (phosphoserine phosphatase)